MGGITLGQDTETSLVYGPSKVALDGGDLSARFPLDELPGTLRDFAAYREGLERDRSAP